MSIRPVDHILTLVGGPCGADTHLVQCILPSPQISFYSISSVEAEVEVEVGAGSHILYFQSSPSASHSWHRFGLGPATAWIE